MNLIRTINEIKYIQKTIKNIMVLKTYIEYWFFFIDMAALNRFCSWINFCQNTECS